MSRHNAIRYAIASALAAGLLAGCAGSGHIASRAGSAKAERAESGKAVSGAEAMVAQAPNDAAARVALAQIYLDAGRFRAAATTFQDAVKLGDTSGRTQLSLALAEIGAGDRQAAVALLDEARDTIPASDRGLALALAGDTNRGVAVLMDALRGGENTPKLRQNLAYAFALDGRWRQARVAMAQDVPADQIDDRIGQWAATAQPEAVQQRVAALLGVPAGVQDPGQPAELALSTAPQGERMAAAEAPAAAPVQTAAAELPPVDQASAAPAPVVPASEAPAPRADVPSGFAAAFAPAPAAVQPGFVSRPVIQSIPASQTLEAPRVAALAHPRRQRAAATSAATPRQGTHLVQLGSFSSESGARRAIGVYTARNAQLRGYRLTIIPAVVNGKNYWRVAAAGLDGSAARHLCSGVKDRGGACFAYAANRAPAGAKVEMALAGSGSLKARR